MMLATNVRSTFKLSDNFLDQYRGKQPNWGFGDLSYFTYKRTYARVMEDGNQEEFVDTLERVVNGCFRTQEKHCKMNGLAWNAHKAQYTAQEMFVRMWEFKFLPPGRGLWMMGTDHVEKVGSAALNNCGFISTKDIGVEFGAPFAWAMDMLMLGVGIGFDTRGVGQLTIHWPVYHGEQPVNTETDYEEGFHEFDTHDLYVIPDTREGWVESVRLCINSFQKKNGKPVLFDYRLVRKAGEPIKGFGGVSSGPAPLHECHSSIRLLLSNRNGQLIQSTDIVDLFNIIGKCVVAGNVRRSAELAIGESWDTNYIQMKDYRRFPKEMESHRWASNNSVFVDRFTNFDPLIENIALNGEPGLIFLSNARMFGRFKDGFISEEDDRYDHVDGFNPCAEQQLLSNELCTLVETFPSNHDTVEDYLRTLKFAYLYAKTVTLIPTHNEKTNAVMARNRRIGCSMSGIQQAIVKFGRQKFFNEICDEGYKTIKNWDRVYSRWLGIPRSIRMTTVKPSGTVSLLAGVLPGVHFGHAEAYWRTVRLAANSSLLSTLLDAGYRVEFAATDKDKLQKIIDARHKVGSIDRFIIKDEESTPIDNMDLITGFNINESDTLRSLLPEFAAMSGTVVVYFPVIDNLFQKSKFDVTIWEQLATVREMQHYWADNAVSCTVTVKDEEKAQLKSAIEFVAPYVKTLSFLPLTNHKYAQAPYQEASRIDIEDYAAGLLPLDLSGKSNTKITGSKFCDSESCSI